MIPNVFHFILYTQPVEGREVRPFSLLHYAAIRSCIETQRPDKVVLWTNGGQPDGEWWERVQDQVEVRERELVFEWKGLDFRKFGNLGHFCDIPRIQIVYEEGGVYADIDTIFVRDLASVRAQDTAFVQSEPSLSPDHDGPTRPMTSILMAHKGDRTLQAALDVEPQAISTPPARGEQRIVYCSYVFKHVHERLGLPLRTADLEALEVPVWASLDVLRRFFVEDAYQQVPDKGYLINVCESDSRRQFVQAASPEAVWEHWTSFHRLLRKYVPRPVHPVTAIMPVMIDSQDRLENALAVLQHMHRTGVERAVVVERGRPVLWEQVRDLEWVDYVFVQADGLPFNKAKLVNTGLHWVRTPVVCVWDCDAVIRGVQVEHATRYITQGEAQAVAGMSRYLHVGRSVVEQVKAGRVDYGVADRPDEIIYEIDNILSHGVCFFDTAVLRHTRGYNELFWGWGCEDDEIVIRLVKLGHRFVKIAAPGLHLTHARTESCLPDHDHYDQNVAERDRALSLDGASFAAYFGLAGGKPTEYSSRWTARPAEDSRSGPTSTD